MQWYIYISDTCQQQIQLYHLEEQIEKIKYSVEVERNSHQFETFSHPYYVRKHISHRYRLLTKIHNYSLDGEDYKVFIFLNIYSRGDKEYKNLYINAKSYGDSIYEQQNIAAYLDGYLRQRIHLSMQKEVKSIIPYELLQPRLNVYLNLKYRDEIERTTELYIEHASWLFVVKPKLTAIALKKVYADIFRIMDSEHSSLEQYSEFELSIERQDESIILRQKQQNDDKYLRIFPQEVLFDIELWLAIQQLDLPLYLMPLQRKLIDSLYYQSYRAVLYLNAEHNTGKTSILALIYTNLLLQKSLSGVENVLFIVSEHEKKYLQEQIQIALQLFRHLDALDFTQFKNLAENISRTCIDLKSWLLNQLNVEYYFLATKYIDESYFHRLWQTRFADEKKISASFAWYVIQNWIKGHAKSPQPLWSGQSLFCGFDSAILDEIEARVWRAWYKPLMEQGFWDEQDLVRYALHSAEKLPCYRGLLIDNSQNYSVNAISLLMQQCVSLNSDISAYLTQIPVIFSGNPTCFTATHHQSQLKQLFEHKELGTFDIQHNESLKILDADIYFVDCKNENIVADLLAEPHLIWQMGGITQEKFRFLQQYIVAWQHLEPAEINFPIAAAYQPTLKAPRIVMLGFSSFLKDIKENSLLAHFHQAFILEKMQQGLSEIYILDSTESFSDWKSFLALNAKTLTVVQEGDFEYRNKRLAEIKKDEQQAKNAEDYLHISTAYRSIHEYDLAFQFLAKAYYLQQNYPLYFEQALNDKYRLYLFALFWQYQQAAVFLKYHAYHPESLSGNLAILAVNNDDPNLYSDKLHTIIVAYREQKERPLWTEYWQILLPLFLKKIRTLKLSAISDWEKVSHLLMGLEDLGVTIANDTFAYVYYRLQNKRYALQYWQRALNNAEITTYPHEYYVIQLEQAQTNEEKIVAYLALRNTRELMNTLLAMDMNQLQAEYWEKILDYLYEEDELKPLLKILLPYIHSQELLEKLYSFCKNHSSDKFTIRIQRFKTLMACIHGDWSQVLERLEHYIPPQDTNAILKKLQISFAGRVKTNNKNNQAKGSLKFNEELIDILYALNLNSTFMVYQNTEEYQSYIEQEYVREVYDAIRKNFALYADDEDKIFWKYQFHAVRALCCLLEKSPQPLDALGMYEIILHQHDKKDNFYRFSLERLAVVMQRLRGIEQLSENVQKKMVQLDIKYKKVMEQNNVVIEPPVLKSTEELIQSILALTPQENAEIQRIEQEEIRYQKELAEQERQAREREAAQRRAELEQAVA